MQKFHPSITYGKLFVGCIMDNLGQFYSGLIEQRSKKRTITKINNRFFAVRFFNKGNECHQRSFPSNCHVLCLKARTQHKEVFFTRQVYIVWVKVSSLVPCDTVV